MSDVNEVQWEPILDNAGNPVGYILRMPFEAWLGPAFAVGEPVRKKKGYPFRGWVVSVFETREKKLRYVVEHATEVGMLHIYSEEQLEYDYERALDEGNIPESTTEGV